MSGFLQSTRRLSFSSPDLECALITAPEGHSIRGRAIVVNPSPVAATLDVGDGTTIAPFSSTIVVDVAVTSRQPVIVINGPATGAVPEGIDLQNWSHLSDIVGPADPEVAETALWRSPQDDLGQIDIASYSGLPSALDQIAPCHLTVRANLWFAPSGTHCRIHNRHEFIEFHSQIAGSGRMQRFRKQDINSLYEETQLSTGQSHPIYECCADESGTFLYPWHQYYAETNSIWLAIEYHAV